MMDAEEALNAILHALIFALVTEFVEWLFWRLTGRSRSESQDEDE